MLSLLIDTTSPLCSLALVEAGQITANLQENLGTRHAELLVIKIKELLEDANINKNELQMIAPVIGPGSFTGIRISIATAKALSLGLKCQTMGVDAFNGLAIDAQAMYQKRPVTVVFEAYRNELYVQEFTLDGLAKAPPFLLPQAEIANIISDSHKQHIFIGTGVSYLEEFSKSTGLDIEAAFLMQERPSLMAYAKLIHQQIKHNNFIKPKPLYIREADAKTAQTSSFIAKEALQNINADKYKPLL